MMNSIMEKVSENIEYFAGKVKSQIINLSTMLTPLQKVNDERVWTTSSMQRLPFKLCGKAGEALGKGLLVALFLKGLPGSHKPFTIH